jgi:hypothetical protein
MAISSGEINVQINEEIMAIKISRYGIDNCPNIGAYYQYTSADHINPYSY